MKRIILSSFVLIGALLPNVGAAEDVVIGVNGLVCGFCAQGIKKSFLKVESVGDVQVDLGAKKVSLSVKEGKKISDDDIKSIITNAGFTVTGIERK